MTVALIPSAQIVRRVLQAECSYTLARLKVLERLPGNPVGVAYRRLGDGFALSARGLPAPSFNRVTGLTDEWVDETAALIEWFESRGIVGRFEITAGAPSPRVTAALARAGYAQCEFHAVLFGGPRADGNDPSASARGSLSQSGVTTEVVDAASLEDFLDAYAAGRAVGDREGFKNNVRGWLGQPGWTLYLGRHDGRAAGGAILFLDGRTGYCADAAVDPALRGHGIHRALLERRSADAAAAGADLLCAQADFLSTSHANMVRAGMSLLCTKAIWRRPAH